jgi:hypothetical protein
MNQMGVALPRSARCEAAAIPARSSGCFIAQIVTIRVV